MSGKTGSNPIGRREFIRKSSLAAISVPVIGNLAYENANFIKTGQNKTTDPEWRNRQEGMSYRRLGRTGLMVSELAYGTERNNPDNLRPIEIAFERGINYFDTAPSYNKGLAEATLAKVFNSPSKRDKAFIATKVTSFSPTRNRLYREFRNCNAHDGITFKF